MNASATTTSTLAYRTCPASPATTCSPGVSAPSLSPFLATQLPCTDHPTTTTTTTAATEATHRDRNTNAAIPNGNSNSDSEYLFIDNHDGTAYLADASLQLDGSYVLGETILLARSEAASPNSTSMRQRTNGAVSPVVVLQTADRLPPQHRREQFAHRPLRGTTLQPAAATAGAARAAAPFTSPTPRPLAGSPTPMSFNDSFASPVAPSVARVLVRRSPAPERAVSVEEDAHHHPLGASCVLGSTFNHSFRFDQTLLVPLDDTLRSSLAAPASPSVAADRHGGPAPSIYRSNDTDAPRWDSGASPLVMMPASPAASVVVYRSARSPALPMASSASRASPTPHAPSVTRQIASQQARATRDTRPSRPEQDIVYLVPPGAATAIVTPEDITQQGWIPVQVVDVLPASKGGSAPNSSSSSGYARNGGGNPPVMIEGRMVSPVPKDPAMQNEPAEEEEVVREQSLSRLSYGRTDERPANGTLRNASFSFASTLSASTLDCINRRLSYSLSDWASVRQRFGHSMSAGDPGSVSGVVMPPATPLTFSVIGGEGQQQQQQTTPTTASANVHMDCHCNAGVRLGGGGAVRDRVEGTWLEDGHDDGGSPVPLPPPGTPEPPQREQSPSRCTTTDAAPTTTHDTAETWTAAAAAESHLANSLLTSMSYQRPSTITTSDEYPGDYSMSLPLTSSASQSLGLNGGRARYSNAESLSLLHFPLQHQALRAPHPRRVSGATALSQAASSFSFQLLGEQSDQQGAGLSSNTNTNSNSAAAAAAAAAATSFRTTYCTNPGSVAVTSLNPSVSGAGLPLSRGALGASVGARSTATGVGGATSRFPSHTQHYAAAAAERRRAGPTGTGAHVNAASLSTDSFAGRSGAVNRNVAQHHPYLSVQQRQQQQLARRVVAAGGGGNGGGLRRAAKARLVPDTSAFLPWSPLTITPEGSLNLPRNDADVAAAMTDACGLPMNLVPYSSSAETSTRTTTTTTTRTTTTTSGGESRSAQAVAQQLLDNRGGNEAVELSPEALRALNAAVAAVTRAADESSSISEAFVKEDGTLNKDAFVSSFLQHAASQAATSVGDTSVNAASTMTTTTTTTASGGEKSLAVSRASMTASEVHLPDHSRRYDFQFMTLMEATMNHFQGSVSAVSALEPEPQAPAPAAPTAAAALSATHVAPAGGEKENGNAVRTSAARKSESIDAVRPAGLRAGSLTNAARPSFKTRSPSHHTTAEDPTATTKNATA
ncbi:hypothetical protein ABB37_07906 [Leptomonas pyrrhocoris]|uniref:Uncharacterized protein n=1 Tax=Leptomonas pyrrhocoris TaxID=157538 RepID=A0A0M9FUD7_LEPPY|nr:hypothetical protein ABB37_07906 [Leptomonas pyrrhocoris]KPA76139.1 hypothetical protein ABB37_07906 [Leptomonas pyrrhocoris]|eukprot:XP_015654578.1 hypothetical protein ABB37_07906 [Leptomonas pyrrhocoris]